MTDESDSVRGEVEALRKAQGRRRNITLAILGGAAVAIGGGALYVRHREAAKEEARRAQAAQAWADAQQCLLGARLDAVVSPAMQVRRIELAGKPSDWPERCAE